MTTYLAGLGCARHRPMPFDVIIAGGGPGGSTAAFYLAAGGARVLVLDKDELPREKACGDAVSAEAFELLVEMGLGEDARRWFGVERMLLTSPALHRAVLYPTPAT